MAEVIIENGNFEEEVLKSDIPVLVDFWAVWCGPCKMLGPVISGIAKAYDGKLKVCKADVDDNGELAQQYGISSIPTVILFKNGEAVARSVGAKNRGEMEKFIAQVL